MSYELFANTGIQYIDTGIRSQLPAIWEHPRNHKDRVIAWMQARAIEGRVILVVDTRTGSAAEMFLADSENSIPPHPTVRVAIPVWDGGTLVRTDEVIVDILRGNHHGAPIEAAFVLDLGNCRSMGLLVERGIVLPGSFRLPGRPFRLYDHRFFGFEGKASAYESVFDSRFELVCQRLTVDRPDDPPLSVGPAAGGDSTAKSGWFQWARKETKPEAQVAAAPVPERVTALFPDWSAARFGAEADFFRQLLKPNAGILTGMSSPKRYLWASERIIDDIWHHILPERNQFNAFCEHVKGPIFGCINEHDADSLSPARENPVDPRYPRRVMMVLCLYELIAQAMMQVNSIEYRRASAFQSKKRELKHVVMSYPSVMSRDEVDRYRTQAEKAIKILARAFHLKQPPKLEMRIDEGSAGQLAYVFGEIRAFGSGSRWLETVGRHDVQAKRAKARIASLDIGGGTTDLMIADYTAAGAPPVTRLHCEIQHLDGMSKAGDELVLAVIERIVIPAMANQLQLSREQVIRIFANVDDQAFSAQKRRWVSEIWVPIARHYLGLAEAEAEGKSFTFQRACAMRASGAIVEMHRAMADKGIVTKDPNLVTIGFDRTVFEKEVVRLALERMLAHFSQSIVAFDCDLLLLAGRPTRLPAVQRVLRQYVPLSKSRIIALDQFHTGEWYPLANPPNCIQDPKSVVVVGAAVEFLCAMGGTGNIEISVAKSTDLQSRAYHWGKTSADDPHFKNEDALFKPRDGKTVSDEDELVGAELIIARRLSADEKTEASPVYCLTNLTPPPLKPVPFKLRRVGRGIDERLELPEEYQRRGLLKLSLRTLYEDRYFLDTDRFARIDYEAITLH